MNSATLFKPASDHLAGGAPYFFLPTPATSPPPPNALIHHHQFDLLLPPNSDNPLGSEQHIPLLDYHAHTFPPHLAPSTPTEPPARLDATSACDSSSTPSASQDSSLAAATKADPKTNTKDQFLTVVAPDGTVLEKPRLSYAHLICRAIAHSYEGKMTLSRIYDWIMATFPYYRVSESGWQNSVRHNLSTNPCFIKEPRPKEAEGKGSQRGIPRFTDRGSKLPRPSICPGKGPTVADHKREQHILANEPVEEPMSTKKHACAKKPGSTKKRPTRRVSTGSADQHHTKRPKRTAQAVKPSDDLTVPSLKELLGAIDSLSAIPGAEDEIDLDVLSDSAFPDANPFHTPVTPSTFCRAHSMDCDHRVREVGSDFVLGHARVHALAAPRSAPVTRPSSPICILSPPYIDCSAVTLLSPVYPNRGVLHSLSAVADDLHPLCAAVPFNLDDVCWGMNFPNVQPLPTL